jgi:hypothetical protein
MNNKQDDATCGRARRILVTQTGEEYHYLLCRNYLEWRNPARGIHMDEVRG